MKYSLIPIIIFIFWIIYTGGIRIPRDIIINDTIVEKHIEFSKLYSIIEIPLDKYIVTTQNATQLTISDKQQYDTIIINQTAYMKCKITLFGDSKILC